ncbi:M14 family metallopeptidase [Autumnicola musiva]|uniref:M14 family metallopeptidase n=1 Tax=Autumnicola musiva TaxID=3075589 RepID=A0ABU3D9X9_9FLAO|nr:M14 family metallopeptidase [Zunongwangia sp. F117]MDT0678345.1 M14 family metallopeptidase [Zunongwangia sp. F117]
MKRTYLFLLLIAFPGFAQKTMELDYYLPQEIHYNPKIPKPQEVLGFVPGEWHVSHDRLIMYMQKLAESSPRVKIENRGTTYEGRPLMLLYISSEENINNLEKIRQDHLGLIEENSGPLNLENMPVIVNQGFSIHGDEPSGANAAMVLAYYLAAAEGPKIEKILDNNVILLDPSFNPDGLQRFAYWANTNKSKNINSDPQDREYDEVWPGGRTNHYWFDMNRDWLPVQLPESQARIETFYKWYPNVLTDHHEMDSNSSFFFQPGIPSQTHPLTPQHNQILTKEIGSYIAESFDEIGSLYYTEEDFDDFYYGKGATFPDINGGIGILFEQASSRGHAQETDNGVLTFPFTIRNQFTAALGTLKAATEMRLKLLNYQRDFYNNARQEASEGAYIFGSKEDPVSAFKLAEILKKHQIKIHNLSNDFSKNRKHFSKGNAYVVPKNQSQNRLLKAMFETRTSFKDSLFYDVSAWSLPLAFNLNFVEDISNEKIGEKIENLILPKPAKIEKSEYAYLMDWRNYNAPGALNRMLTKGLRAKVAMKNFSVNEENFSYGTIMISVKNQSLSVDEIYNLIQEISEKTAIPFKALKTGLTGGISLGSNNFRSIKPQSVALIVGERIRPFDAGEIWHLFDQRFDMRITKLDIKNLSQTDLSRYTDIILTASYGGAINKNQTTQLKEWVKSGGSLIAYRSSVKWLKENEFINLKFKEIEDTAININFEEIQDYKGAQRIGGAIFKVNMDRSHPISFGYTDNNIASFRNTEIFMEADKDSYNNPLQYADEPLLSGYISKENLDLLAGSVPLKVQGLGRGKVMAFTDNPNFRAFWLGTNKLLMNAIFFGDEM